MSVLTHFLEPEVFAKLTDHELEKLAAVIDLEIVTQNDIKKRIQDRLKSYLPYLPSLKGSKP